MIISRLLVYRYCVWTNGTSKVPPPPHLQVRVVRFCGFLTSLLLVCCTETSSIAKSRVSVYIAKLRWHSHTSCSLLFRPIRHDARSNPPPLTRPLTRSLASRPLLLPRRLQPVPPRLRPFRPRPGLRQSSGRGALRLLCDSGSDRPREEHK